MAASRTRRSRRTSSGFPVGSRAPPGRNRWRFTSLEAPKSTHTCCRAHCTLAVLCSNAPAMKRSLAGLFAHELAHGSGLVTRQGAGSIPLMTPACVLASPVGAFLNGAGRDEENQATSVAADDLRLAGYDPLAMLEFLSKLSFEHPAWSRAI